MQPPISLEPNGLVHNRYRIVRIIGQGGMGAVYEAIDQRLGNTVALKQMIVSGEQFSQAFEREARLLAGLRHPSLPKVMDFFADGDQQFLVMEFIPGADLAALRRERSQPFAVEEVLRWADQALQALEFLHSQRLPIIHRDIKPQNLKVTPDGNIVLLDFGLAKGSTPAFSHVATTNSIFGYTPLYAPLEQIQGTGTTSASDIYSLSATLYHLLTDTPPVDVLARAGAVVGGRPDPMRPANELNAQVWPAVGTWLLRGLQLDQPKRYGSAAEMRAALHQLQRGAISVPVPPTNVATLPPTMVVPTTQPPSQPYPLPPMQQYPSPTSQPYGQAPARRSVLPWVIAGVGGVVVLLGLVAVIAFLLLRQQTPTQASSPSATAASSVSGVSPTEKALTVVEATPAVEATPVVVPSTPAVPPTSAPLPSTPTIAPSPAPQFGPMTVQRPASASASASAPSGTDSAGSPITYGPENAIDGAEDTAWRVPGAGIGQALQLTFAGPIRVREVLVLPGYAKTDAFDGSDRFKQNRRVRRARLEFSDGSSVEAQFADARQLQLVSVNPVVTTSIRIVILDTTEPAAVNGRDFTPISEVVVRGEAQQ